MLLLKQSAPIPLERSQVPAPSLAVWGPGEGRHQGLPWSLNAKALARGTHGVSVSGLGQADTPPGSPSVCGAPVTCQLDPAPREQVGKPRLSLAGTEPPLQSAKTGNRNSDRDNDRGSMTTKDTAPLSACLPNTPHGSCGPPVSFPDELSLMGAPPSPGVCCAGVWERTQQPRHGPGGGRDAHSQPRVQPACCAGHWAQAICPVR